MIVESMEWPLSKEELKYLYWEEKMSTYKLADSFNKTRSTIRYYLNKYNIKTRSTNNRKTTKQFIKEVQNLVGNEYKVLEKYKNAYTKIKVKHNKCNYIYKVKPSHFLRGNRCPKCAGFKRNTKTFKEEVYKLEKENYKVLGEYVNARKKILMKHVKCGHRYKVAPYNFLGGKRCPKCANKKSHQKFKKEFYNLVGNEYELLSKYDRCSTKIKIKHKKCGHTYKVSPHRFLGGNRCPKCARSNYSKGEKIIGKILNKNNIKYSWQHKFKRCKNKRKLPFDFKIKDKPIVIEYNGRQHYEAVEYYGGKKQLKYRQKIDNIKREYCKKNDIKLIEIPYWEKDNIEEILSQEL